LNRLSMRPASLTILTNSRERKEGFPVEPKRPYLK
jgi:hypothetical protein